MATISFKTLIKVVAPSSATQEYTPGAGKQAIIKGMSFCNQTGTQRTVTIYRNGIAAGDASNNGIVVPPNKTVDYDKTFTLGPTDTLGFGCDAGSAVLVTADGAEITL